MADSSADVRPDVHDDEVARPYIRKRFRIQGEKFCRVCGDKALAHHFGALACETCKAFFRRNALRQQEVKPCNFTSSCQIDKNTRRFCPCCRLKKCFDIGMQADLIFDEDQRKELQEKVKKKRQRWRGLDASPCGSDSSSPTLVDSSRRDDSSVTSNSASMETTPNRASSQSDQSLSMNGPPSPQQASGQTSNVGVAARQSHGSLEGRGLHDLVQHQTKHTSTISQSESSKRAELSPSLDEVAEQKKVPMMDLKRLTRDQLPSDPHMYWRLSEEERMLLTLLSAAYEDTMLASLRERKSTQVLDASNYSLNDFFADCDMDVRHAVNFVRRLEDFQRLDLDDQIACFKASISSVISVRDSFIFVEEGNLWLMNKGYLTVDFSKTLFPRYSPYIDWDVALCRQLKSVAKNDVTIYTLLHCILLFDPCGQNVCNRQLVSTMRDKYVILLRHYLEATFSFLYAEDYVRVLQNQIVEIREMNRVADYKDIFAVMEGLGQFKLLVELTNCDN